MFKPDMCPKRDSNNSDIDWGSGQVTKLPPVVPRVVSISD